MEGETDLGGEIAWSKERGLGKGGTQKKEYLKFFTWEEVQLIQGTEVRIMNLEIRKGESLVQFSRSVMSNSLRPHESQHTRPPCTASTPGVHPNPCPSSRWCHPTISFSSSPSLPALILSQHQGLFQRVNTSHEVAKVLEFQLQHQSLQRIFKTDLLWDELVWSPWSPRNSEESSPTPQFKSINSLAVSFIYSPAFTSIHDYWKSWLDGPLLAK